MVPINLPTLTAHDRKVNSPFGLLGTDENALSFALGYTFQQCLPLLQWFLRQIGIPGVHRTSLRKAQIDLQRRRGEGITDIEIHLPGYFHVIVEAKLGLSVPSLKQCQKYMARFQETEEPLQRLVALVQSPDTSFVEKCAEQDPELSKRLVHFSWPHLLPRCSRIMQSKSVGPEPKTWVRAFYCFLDQEYRMKAFTTEVWVLAIDTKPLWRDGPSHWDIHTKHSIYWDQTHPNVRPLYLAFRVNGKVDGIYRVNRIEHDVPIIDLVPELANVKKKWPKWPFTIWHFGPKVCLPNPLRTGAGMYNRRVRCDLDVLLSCETVLEVEQAMNERRKQSEAKAQ